MLSIKEVKDKTRSQGYRIKKAMERDGFYHPSQADLMENLTRAEKLQIAETLQTVPLREFLQKGTTAGADYLIANKVHLELVSAAQRTDIVPLISRDVVSGWKGADLDVAIAHHDSLRGRQSAGGGGEAATQTIEVSKATCTPKPFSIDIQITNELLEDQQWNLIQQHVNFAGAGMGYRATELAIPVLAAGADGDGTLNSATTASTDTTIWSEIQTAIKGVECDEFGVNTMLLTRESWFHNITGTMGVETAGGAAGDFWQGETVPILTSTISKGFDMKAHTLDVLFSSSPQLHDSGDAAGAAFTTCITIIFDRNNAMLTARKRWLQIENYSHPIQDLAGAHVSARQDSVSLFNDSIYTLTEKT